MLRHKPSPQSSPNRLRSPPRPPLPPARAPRPGGPTLPVPGDVGGSGGCPAPAAAPEVLGAQARGLGTGSLGWTHLPRVLLVTGCGGGGKRIPLAPHTSSHPSGMQGWRHTGRRCSGESTGEQRCQGVTDSLTVTPRHLRLRHQPVGANQGPQKVLLPPPPAPNLHPGGDSGRRLAPRGYHRHGHRGQGGPAWPAREGDGHDTPVAVWISRGVWSLRIQAP